MSDDPLIPVWPDVGRALGFGREKAYRLAKQDRLPVPTHYAGRKPMCLRADLDRFLAGETAPEPESVSPPALSLVPAAPDRINLDLVQQQIEMEIAETERRLAVLQWQRSLIERDIAAGRPAARRA